ncbi:MAG: dihydroorotase [bacterium]|nr:dihydroorotase [bacterium]
MKTAICGGRLIDPSQDIDGLFDIIIENDLVSDIVKPGMVKDVDNIINAKGLVVIPGIVDIHIHLRDPGYEYKEDIASGTMAAAAGGVTSVACMANTKPVNDNASVTADIIRRSRESGHVKVYPIGAMTKGLKGDELAEIACMKEAGIVAVSDDGLPVNSAEIMRRGLEYSLGLDLPVISHAEEPSLSKGGSMNEGYRSTVMGLQGIPNASEDIMVMRDIALAELTGARLHIAHISSEAAVRFVREAKTRGVRVTAEAAPHHFVLTEEALEGYDANTKMNPPLRCLKDVEAIKAGLKDGTIDAVATDHAPHTTIEKDVEFDKAACGIIGLETLLPLTLSLVDEGVLSLDEAVRKLTINPANIIGIKGGSLKEGMPADIAIIDIDTSYRYDKSKVKSKSNNTPFDGWEMKGRAAYTIVNGKIVYKGESYE